MSPMIKWIGGVTALVALFFASAAVTGYVLDQQDERTQQPSIAAEPVIATEDAPRIAPVQEPAAEPEPAPAPTQEAAPVVDDSPFVIKRILPIEGPIKYGEWHWDDEGVPDGPLVMTVDLDARVISVFRGGYEIGAAAVLLGTQDHPTPLGTFPILQKKRHNISSIYNVPMPYTMRLTWDGIAIHESEVENGYASHGCIGTPGPFAAKLFAIAKKGDKVIITRGKKAGIGTPLTGA